MLHMEDLGLRFKYGGLLEVASELFNEFCRQQRTKDKNALGCCVGVEFLG